MKITRVALALSLAGMLASAMAITGCSKTMKNMFVPNQLPTVRLTSAPYDTTGRYFYAYKLDWIGNDPDGRVDYFLYAIDPPLDGSPIEWTKTFKNEQIVFFRATTPDPQDTLGKAIAFHVFAIRAVDNGGDSSAVVTRAFFSYTVAPSVQITDPVPSHLTTAYVTPSVRFTWTGQDPDGQLTQKPIKYKFKLFSQGGEFPLDVALGAGGLNKLRDFYAPRFAGWDSTSGDTTTVQYTNLTPDASYLFVVVAFDEAGAYSPIFSLDTNCLRLVVKLAAAGGPHICIGNEFFQYCYLSGSYNPQDQNNWIFVEVPFNQPITFNWFATSDPGALVSYYRWRLGGDVSDDTPRSNENTDIRHWSSPSINTTSATVGPFLRDTLLFFYVEAADNNGLKSLGIVNFRVVKPTFDHALGVINDTRYVLDVIPSGRTTYLPPSGNWPTAAEFDTFLFAHGGAVYRQYPAGTVSRPGVFAGYDYDTFSTRVGKSDLTVPLSEMGKFRHVIWITDALASAKSGNGNNLANSVSALAYMNNRNKVNTLATYVKQGGQVWLLGSGIAHAAQINFDRSDGGTYSNDGRELIPGRFMFDLVHWRNDIHDVVGSVYSFHKPLTHPLTRSPGIYPVGSYPAPPPPGSFAGDYSAMPDTFRVKSLALGDSMPPYRSSGFYQTNLAFSELLQENRIIENMNPDPIGVPDNRSTLDTLYNVKFPQPNPSVPADEFPIATYYHGLDNSSIFYTPIDAWLLSKADFVSLVDFVVHGVWGLDRNASFAAQRPAVATVARPFRPATPAGRPTFQSSARTLIGGGARPAPRRALTPPGHKPQE